MIAYGTDYDDPFRGLPHPADQAEPPSAVTPLPGLDLTRLGAAPAEPDWIVQDVLARGWLVLLGAKPGVGKTWVAHALCAALPTGQPWLGHDVGRTRRVLYVDAENGEDLALERLQQLGATAEELGDRLHYVTESVTFPNHHDVERFKATLDQHKPDVVVIDTLASVAPTAERDTESAAAFYTAVWHAVRDRGASLILLVHLRKTMQGAGRDDALDAFRGAGHLIGAAHRAWTLESVGTDKPVFLMHDVKARRGHKLPTVRIEVVDEEDSDPLRTSVNVVGTVDEVESGHDTYIAEILTYLDNVPTGQSRMKDLLLLPSAPVERTAKDHISRAVASGVLARVARGVYARAGLRLPIATEPEEVAR